MALLAKTTWEQPESLRSILRRVVKLRRCKGIRETEAEFPLTTELHKLELQE